MDKKAAEQVASLLLDPKVMGSLALEARHHPRATEEERTILIVMTLINRLEEEEPIRGAEAKKMGQVLWQTMKKAGWISESKVMGVLERLVHGFPPRSNDTLRDEILEDIRRKEGPL